jgi:chromosome segregation ATPase
MAEALTDEAERLRLRLSELESVVRNQEKALQSKSAVIRMLRARGDSSAQPESEDLVQALEEQLDANPEAAKLAADRNELQRKVHESSQDEVEKARSHVTQLQSQLHAAQRQAEDAKAEHSRAESARCEAETARQRSEHAFTEQNALLQEALDSIQKAEDERDEEEEARIECEKDLEKAYADKANEVQQRIAAEADASRLRERIDELSVSAGEKDGQQLEQVTPSFKTLNSKAATPVRRPALAALTNANSTDL